ncbi:MAG TPA: response regulator transcription factor [Candidatus Limnocylindria bacterium]|nr:response regulator transcription factor [Candidatus Limnocylindria bacterium]
MTTPIDVVYADDSYLMREAVGGLLDGARGVNLVAVCSDGDELSREIAISDPAVVVTDMRMPPSGDEEGLRVAERLRRERPSVGVVVLTQIDDAAYGRHLLEHGAEGRAYLLKERMRDRAELVAAIELVAAGGTAVDPAIVERMMAGGGEGAATASGLDDLTARERQVLALMAQGKSNGAIAEELVLTRRGVEKHVGVIFSKLGLADEGLVSRRVAAVLRYLEATTR